MNFANDVATDPDGNADVVDRLGALICRVDAAGDVSVFVESTCSEMACYPMALSVFRTAFGENEVNSKIPLDGLPLAFLQNNSLQRAW